MGTNLLASGLCGSDRTYSNVAAAPATNPVDNKPMVFFKEEGLVKRRPL